MNSLLLFFFPSNIPALPIYLGEKERKKVLLFQIPNKDVSVFQLCVIAQMRKNNIIYMANVVKMDHTNYFCNCSKSSASFNSTVFSCYSQE